MPQNPTLEERRLLTLRLRIAGWSYREIATRVGVSPAQVFRDIKRVCDQLRKEQYATAAQLRTQTAMALEEKLTRWWTRADVDPAALDRVIKLLAERSKLFGLHAPPQQVELRRVRAGDLRPDPRNWRRHPPGQRAALSRMLDRLGYVDAVIARETPDGLVLVDGHLRAGMSPDAQIPVLVVDLDHSEAGEVLATLDPLAAMAEADRDALTRLLSDLDAPPPIDLKEMYALAPEPAELKPADVEPILPSEPVSRCGDLWLLGRHRLMCGDATERSQVTRLLDGAQPSLMVTDPPYGVAYDASWRKKAFGSSGGRLGKVRNDDDPSYWAAALEACKTPVAYIWSPSGENVLVFGRILQAAGYGLRNQIIWRKPKMGHCQVNRLPRIQATPSSIQTWFY